MTDCYYEKKDWRACKNEVSGVWPLPASDLPALSTYTSISRFLLWHCT